MRPKISLYSVSNKEIPRFLSLYYNKNFSETLKWEKEFKEPIDMADLIGVFIDNNNKFKINMWVSLDPYISISINSSNGNRIIKYLFERYPY